MNNLNINDIDELNLNKINKFIFKIIIFIFIDLIKYLWPFLFLIEYLFLFEILIKYLFIF